MITFFFFKASAIFPRLILCYFLLIWPRLVVSLCFHKCGTPDIQNFFGEPTLQTSTTDDKPTKEVFIEFRKLKYKMVESGYKCPSSISTFNCCSIFQHFLFDKTITFFLADWQFFSWIFYEKHFFVILSNGQWASINLSWAGVMGGPTKMWAWSVQPFWRLSVKQKNKYIYR